MIPVHGQLPHTQRCLESLRQHTPQPFELILIDNASPDETAAWLKQQADVTVISNPTNRGFPTAVNQGLRMAQGTQLVILNNDTVVVAGWLDRLLDALCSSEKVGIVGPCTNRISGEQQIPVTYDQTTLEGLDTFATSWSEAHSHRYEPTDRLVGFCMLLKREVLTKVGYLDEQFGLGNFEDDDYCRRAEKAGYQLLIARDAFIHHVGHATFQGAGVDFQALLERNQALYLKKWQPESTEVALIQPPAEYELADTGNSEHLLLQRKHIRVSLCMIVRNNERFIVECLTSIRPFVDEMIVLDTGSTDRTAELARSVGARVYHFAWCDSFSDARNESRKYARGQWIFWMDSDDVISPECGMKLRLLAYQEHPAQVMGFMMQVHCIGPGPEGPQQVTKVDHVKLFRNHPQLHFEFRMHEQIMMPIRRLGGDIVWTDLFVTHANYDHSPEGQKHKLERDLKLLHLDEAEHPHHTFVLFNLGMT
ncbi:MAG TPA: glycosyltransferase, partial [Gemmatales bacterium]|nr:glycosyltransferase [Gemmatales bacterium]